jgi:hypothetical protein
MALQLTLLLLLLLLLLQEAFTVLEQCRFPVIAAVQGEGQLPAIRQQQAQL